MIYLPYSDIGEILQVSSSPFTGRESIYTDLLPDAVGTLSTTDDTVSNATSKIELYSTPAIVAKTVIGVPTTLTTSVNTTLSITGVPSTVSVVATLGDELTGIKENGNPDNGYELTSIPDGTLEFTTDLAGDYTLVFTSPIYLETTTVITVTE